MVHIMKEGTDGKPHNDQELSRLVTNHDGVIQLEHGWRYNPLVPCTYSFI
jgi:hypothetical protein